MVERAERFDRLYAEKGDPWNFRGSPYEAGKYEATLAALPRKTYRLGVEAGCSIGELTRRLAGRCERVVGLDVSAVALDTARRRHADPPRIDFMRAELPGDWPPLGADLVVLSEVLYYLSAAEIAVLGARIARDWAADGDCVLVNYLGETGEALSGAEAAALFVGALRAHGAVSHRGEDRKGYRIDVLSRVPEPLTSPLG